MSYTSIHFKNNKSADMGSVISTICNHYGVVENVNPSDFSGNPTELDEITNFLANCPEDEVIVLTFSDDDESEAFGRVIENLEKAELPFFGYTEGGVFKRELLSYRGWFSYSLNAGKTRSFQSDEPSFERSSMLLSGIPESDINSIFDTFQPPNHHPAQSI